MSGLKIGVVGATGMVGRQYLEILEESALEIAELRNVEIQIMPLVQESHAGLQGPMRLLETPENKWFAYCEGQVGWIPYMLERAEKSWIIHGASSGCTPPPAEIYRDHIYACMVTDAFAVAQHRHRGAGLDLAHHLFFCFGVLRKKIKCPCHCISSSFIACNKNGHYLITQLLIIH